jgi:hypothetical protein
MFPERAKLLMKSLLRCRVQHGWSRLLAGTAVAGALLLGACAQPTMPDEHETFITHIHEDGTKIFEYHLDHRDPSRLRTFIEFRDDHVSDHYIREPVEDGRERDHQRAERRFLTLARDRIKRSGFCREGYITLEEKIGTATSMLRGECRESATEDDREAFPNRFPGLETPSASGRRK